MMRTIATVLTLSAFALLARPAEAKLKTEEVEYKDGDTVLQGYFAYDDAKKGKRPVVLVVHEWWGHGPYVRMRADELAKEGYLAFAVDMYGKGVYAKTHEEAGKLSGALRGDRKAMRQRITAGLERAKQHPMADASRVAATGYCFGGTTVIELARSGADLKAVASFHGGLDSPTPADGKNIRASVYAFHGANDGFEKPEDLAAFEKEMRDSNVDWLLVKFGGAVHSFTVKEAGNDPKSGMAYNEKADKRSHAMMRALFAEALK